MTILNQSISMDSLSTTTRHAFIAGRTQKRLIPAMSLLFKFTQHPLHSSRGITPWWSAVEPIEPGDTGLAGLLENAKRLGVLPEQYSRARNAVTKQWNTMSHLLIVRLTGPVFAFVGRCSAQRLDDESPDMQNVVYIGGAWQLYLPNLTSKHVVQV